MSKEVHEKLKTIQNAINYEIDHHYVNAIGKKTTFSSFIIQNTKLLSFGLGDKDKLKSLINLFYLYPSQDMTARMDTIHKAQQILKEISEQNKNTEREDTFKSNSIAPRQFEKDLKKIDVKYVKGVGPKMSQVLNRMGIFSIRDLFTYYPRAYIDYQKHKSIKELKVNDNVTVLGVVKGIKAFNPPRKKDLLVITIVIQDDTGKITITKFTRGRLGRVIQEQYKKQYTIGAKVLCAGTVSYDKFSRSFSLNNAVIEVIDDAQKKLDGKSLNLDRIVPVYPLTEGISVEFLRKVISNAFSNYGNLIQETLPKKILLEERLLDLKTSLSQVHFPENQELCNLAKSRIVFEEFFLMQLQLAYRRYCADRDRSGLCLKESKNGFVQKLTDSLPFKLTGAQKRVFEEIKKDLMSTKPMHRLLQGDVGSGKTIVALLALVFAVENGFQTALMAPTEILTQQHFRKFDEYCRELISKDFPTGLQIALLTGSTSSRAKKEIYQGLENGHIKIVVGTHALIQDEVKFANLGLVIIDEQHRFGVKQRDVLLSKGKNIERLFMTATPIPRTLALAMHGDLELSEIDEMPAGRMPVKTSMVQSWQRSKVFDLIKGEVAKGRQAYIVFPLIEESEALSAKAATVEYEELSKSVFKDLRVGLMHGELPSQEKDKIMKAFVDGVIDVLITTTVIEVGVDVSNATVMMIENAERFGLSQLHQLRGRVGRGGEQAYCLLASQTYSEDVMSRLDILTKTTNGFVISQEDLKIRGPGEFLGTKQSGLPDLLLADLINDAEILEIARKKAINVVKSDPTLTNYPELRKLVLEKEEAYILAG